MGSQLHAIEEPIASRTEMGSIANGVSMDRSNDDEEQSSSENVSSQMVIEDMFLDQFCFCISKSTLIGCFF